MELRFEHMPDRQFYVIRFAAGSYESMPILRELRFWGVDRVPCPRMSTLAAMIVLRDHPVTTVTLRGAAINPPVCTALSQQFGVEIHPATYDVDRRDLVGGEKRIAPVRFSRTAAQRWVDGVEALTWTSLNDLRGPLGGMIRTNLDAFDLTEAEKSLIVALCCAGKDVGHVLLEGADPALTHVLHRIGMELVTFPEEV